MYQLVSALQAIGDKIMPIPNWISITGVFVPILLSTIVLIMQILQQKSNKQLQIQQQKSNEQLQKRIYNHEVELKCFDSILSIYTSFSKSVDSLPQFKENLQKHIAKESSKETWYKSLVEIDREMYRKYDFAVLLLGEGAELSQKLKQKMGEYDEIIRRVKSLSTNAEEGEKNDLQDLIIQYMKSMNYEEFDQFFSKYINLNHFLESKAE